MRADTTLADLHYIIQKAFSWTDFHLHRFRFRKKDFAIPRVEGFVDAHDARAVTLGALRFRLNERFLYEYDFGDQWEHEVLQAQGVQANQPVIFLSDGGETVRSLPEFLIPESEHRLDWFHITLHLTGIGQMIKGLVDVPERTDHAVPLSPDDELPSQRVSIEELEKKRESMKWNVWNGNVRRALERTEELLGDLETWPAIADKVVKLKKAVNEFASYIALNQASIPNYGDRRRHGERIASSFVESAVNQVMSKRMVKKQQMRWGERGAHLLSQVRTQVLNGDFRQWFARWYPGMEDEAEPVLLNEAA